MKSRRSKRWFMWGVVGVASVGVCYAFLNSPFAIGRGAIEEEVARLKKLGLSTAPDELRTLSQHDGPNAAPFYAAAGKDALGSYHSAFSTAGRHRALALEGKLGKVEQAELESNLKALQPVFLKLDKGSRQAKLDFRRRYEDSIYMLMPELAMLKGLTNLLALDGLERIRKGDVKTGREKLLAVARITHHLSEEPLFVATIVQCQMQTETVRATLCALQARPDDPQMVALSREVLRELGPTPDLRLGAAGEAVVSRGLARVMGARGAEEFFLNFGFKEADIGKYTLPLLRPLAVRQANEATLLKYWRTYRENLPTDPEDMAAVRDANKKAVATAMAQSSVSRLIWDPLAMFFDGAPTGVADALAARRILVDATTAFETRQRTGSFPTTLKTAADPFTTAPLIYSGSRNEFTLYSLGANAVDDGPLITAPGDPSSPDLGIKVHLK